jgi:hypothetical protein
VCVYIYIIFYIERECEILFFSFRQRNRKVKKEEATPNHKKKKERGEANGRELSFNG